MIESKSEESSFVTAAIVVGCLWRIHLKDPWITSFQLHQEDPYDDNGLDDFDISYNNYGASMHTIYGDDLVLNFESKDQYFMVFFDLFIIPW